MDNKKIKSLDIIQGLVGSLQRKILVDRPTPDVADIIEERISALKTLIGMVKQCKCEEVTTFDKYMDKYFPDKSRIKTQIN